MNDPTLLLAYSAIALVALYLMLEGSLRIYDRIQKRRRQKAKPWRKSKTAPKIEIPHQQKTLASVGKAPVRKSTARIGVKRTVRRR